MLTLCERYKKNCLKPAPGNQIVARVKIKIATVEYLNPPLSPQKNIHARYSTQKKYSAEAMDVKKKIPAS